MQNQGRSVFSRGQKPKTASISTADFRDQIVGKRIEAVVAKPGREGQPPTVLMMQFDDGSVVEWVSPRSDQVLRRALGQERGRKRLTGRAYPSTETLPLPLLDQIDSVPSA